MFETTGVENNQTDRPMVNPRRENVAIYEAPTFPNEGKGPGFPSDGIPWLVNSGNFSIDLNLRITKENNFNQEYFMGS